MWLPFGVGQEPCGGWSGKNQIREACVTKETVPAKVNAQTTQKICQRLQPALISKCDYIGCHDLTAIDCSDPCNGDCFPASNGITRWPASEFPPPEISGDEYVVFNNYATSTNKTFEQCDTPKYGFKAVQFKKKTGGRFGFLHNDACDSGSGTNDTTK